MTTPLKTRDEWGAKRPKATPATITNEGQTLHHGGGSPWPASVDRSNGARFAATTDHNSCPAICRAWQAFHMAPEPGGRGWNDIAYNSLFCPHGVRFEGRGPGKRSGANGTNTGNSRSCASVYIAGTGDPLTDQAKMAALDEAIRFGTHLRWQHSDWKSTECAGDHIRNWQSAGWPPPEGDYDDMSAQDIAEIKNLLQSIHGAVLIDISEGRSDDSAISLIYRNSQELWQEQVAKLDEPTDEQGNGTPAYDSRAAMMRDVFNVPSMTRTIEDRIGDLETSMANLPDEIVAAVLAALDKPQG